MAMTLDEVAAFAESLPDVVVGAKWGNRTWMVGERGFAWQRPFSKADLKRFGDEIPPAGDILAVRVQNLDAKEALLAIAPPGFFTIPHFNGYAAVLIALDVADGADVRAALLDGWRAEAEPSTLAKRSGEPAPIAKATKRSKKLAKATVSNSDGGGSARRGAAKGVAKPGAKGGGKISKPRSSLKSGAKRPAMASKRAKPAAKRSTKR